jgi:uncharacterized protein (TIGR00369 family)
MAEEKPRRSDDEVLATFHNAKRRPKCSDALSMKVERVCQAEGWVEFSFEAKDEWSNPMGNVQGGFLSAMLDDTMSVTGVVGANFSKIMPTLEFKVSFLRPAPVGKFRTVGRIKRLGKSIGFIEADLFDGDGHLVAKSSGTVTPRPIPGRA